MPYVKLKLPPGVFRNGTKYQSTGRWYSANLVRWSEGAMQPIGGWAPVRDSDNAEVSVHRPVRGILGWKSNNQSSYLALGTYDRAYAFGGGALTDITPTDFTAGNVGAVSVAGGYDRGNYDLGLYNVGAGGSAFATTEANSWQFDNFGEYLVACAYSDGKLYWWDLDTGHNLSEMGRVAEPSADGTITSSIAVRATPNSAFQHSDSDAIGGNVSISATPAAALSYTQIPLSVGIPTGCKGVVVTPERFVVALASNDNGRQVHWSDQEDFTEWNPLTAGSQAGDFILPGSGEIMCARRNRNETLIWTDVDLFAMRYIGGVLIYSFAQVGANCGIISRRAVASAEGRTFWMGHKGFFTYDGFAKPIPCEISDTIFAELNSFEASRVAAWSVNAYNEIWFSYPTSGECDKVVCFNYMEGHWSGPWDLARTDGVDRAALGSVVAVGPDGVANAHETGTDYDGLIPSAETGPFEIGSGDNVMTVRRYIPDEKTLGSVDATLYAGFYPTDSEDDQTITINQISDTRLTGRQVRLKIAQAGVDWRFGTPRLEVVARGRR